MGDRGLNILAAFVKFSLVMEPATKTVQTGCNELSPKPQSSVENGACSPVGGRLGFQG